MKNQVKNISKTKQEEILRTAAHEAGHAAAALHLGVFFDSVSIKGDYRYLGRLYGLRAYPTTDPFLLDNYYIILLAGMAGERKINNRKFWMTKPRYWGSGADDLPHVQDFIKLDKRIGNRTVEQYVKELAKMTNDCFDKNIAPLHRALRNSLLEKEELSYSQCFEIYKSIVDVSEN